MNDLQKLFAVDRSKIAPYKIEVQFSTHRSQHKPNPVAITVWESGKKLNGEGDQLMMQCCKIKDGKGCGRFISMDLAVYREHPKLGTELAITCPYCGQRAWTAELATEEYIKIDNQKLAAKIVKIWYSLPQNAADIYVKHHKTNIREAHAKGEGMDVVWATDDYVIYPYANLLKELQLGSDLAVKVRKFLSA